MNNIQIAHLIVKALNHSGRHYRLDSKHKNQLMARMVWDTPPENRIKGTVNEWSAVNVSVLHLNQATQTLSILLKDPSTCFNHVGHFDALVNLTLTYYLEFGA